MLRATLLGDVPEGNPHPSRLRCLRTLQRGALREASLVIAFRR